MEMMTIRQYADSIGVTYESIRVKMKRYSAELSEHITKQNNVTYLDSFAVEFLNAHRMEKFMVESKHPELEEEIQRLKAENEKLKAELLRLQTSNENLSSRVIGLLDEKTVLVEEQAKTKALILDHQKLVDNLEEVKEKLSAAETEVRSYQKTWFGLYKKV